MQINNTEMINMPRKPMEPDAVAASAERQLIELKQAQSKKMQEFMKQRENIANNSRTIQAIAYAVASTYREVFPGAGGFIELRIKTPDSIATKIRNEFTEILDKKQEDLHINQTEILKDIDRIDLKDILAFSVITSVPPQKFRTGDDSVNQKLTELAEELKTTASRIKAHIRFISDSEKKIKDLSNEMKKVNNMVIDNKAKQDLTNILQNSADYAKYNVEYGEQNKERTEETYNKTLRELQYEMSSYFVSNLSKFSTFKFWGAKEIRIPKMMQKPGFRAVNTGYNVIFSDEKNQFKLNFEAQGKGEMDYLDAEFSALGALYHEEQKTKDGLISKKIDMPDFAIIGSDRTKKIEYKTRRKYQEINTIEDLTANADNSNMRYEYENLKAYEARITEEIIGKYGDNKYSKDEVTKKMNEAFAVAKEHLIQNEIEAEINKKISEFANGDYVKGKIQGNEELTRMYEDEKRKLENSNTSNMTEEEIENNARIRVLYLTKEREIAEYAKNSIPTFSRVVIPDNPQDEVMVYTFTTGESIYRYFYNKLNGLRDENGKYKFEPKEQQKRALLKLTGLFEEDYSSFYTYNRETESFETFENKIEGPEL